MDKGIFTIRSATLDGAIGFIKNKAIPLNSFIITPDQNGAVILFKKENSYILFTLSEIKNTYSGWNEKHFDWGKSPVLLKKIGLKCQVNLKNDIKVYELDGQGKRSNELEVTAKGEKKTFSTFSSESPWFEIELK